METVLQPLDPDFAARVRGSFARQGAMGLIGAELSRVEPGLVEIGLAFREDLSQQHGFFHAGVSAMVADSAGGYAAFAPFDAWEVKSNGHAPKPLKEDLLLAQHLAKAVKSNAIVLVKDGGSVGIGAGQMSRVDSVEIAVRKAGDRAKGAVLGSDAFFPFADGLELAAKAGVTAFVEPGGSLRDDEVIAAAQRLGVWLFFTGMRHFRH